MLGILLFIQKHHTKKVYTQLTGIIKSIRTLIIKTTSSDTNVFACDIRFIFCNTLGVHTEKTYKHNIQERIIKINEAKWKLSVDVLCLVNIFVCSHILKLVFTGNQPTCAIITWYIVLDIEMFLSWWQNELGTYYVTDTN